MNRRSLWLMALSVSMTIAGCTSAPSNQNDCAYGGCGDYDIDINISAWDIFGPFLLILLGLSAVGVTIFLVVRANQDASIAPADDEDETEQP